MSGSPPSRGDRVRAEVFGRVVDVVETPGLAGVLVALDTGGEVWLPLDALTVQPPDPAADQLAERRAHRRPSP